jgi:chemotaxis protein MotB
MALFLMIAAAGTLEKEQWEQLAKALQEAFGGGRTGQNPALHGGTSVAPLPGAAGKGLGESKAGRKGISGREAGQKGTSGLESGQKGAGPQPESEGAGPQRRQDERGLVFSVASENLFGPSSADLTPESRRILEKVADELKKTDRLVRVEGHTCNLKPRTYPSNWELSMDRAVRVVKFLVAEGVDPERVSAVGFGPYRPVASNRTEEGRRKNRRVEIILLKQSGDVE